MRRTAPHLVEVSPWPLLVGMLALSLTVNLVMFFRGQLGWLGGVMSFIALVFVLGQWWRDVIRESTYMGEHSKVVVSGLKIGMVLFILSEVMFFFGFFWAFFHASLAPAVELGCAWPPVGLEVIPAMGAPLLNTGILLGSGVSVTYSHHSYLAGDGGAGNFSLLITIILGVLFTGIQGLEYSEASFSIADSVYGSTFFLMTGFHGFHVLVGSTYLLVSLIRGYLGHYSSTHHVGFELAAWYWHFVDVVWIFLFIWVYWWGS
uniref:Cytochrome c oxidase subunit 3 n=1 Tax=Sabella spallanzanii TaxID=85702 RepID=A0A7T1SSS6_SABSP|nr:cytochrome c oxidase subunit III [Sabella spallanzanii]QPO99961.1 cytochrome c oxidase subunit 3 [Sabella spallanzanii]UJM44183.1 cytochrome c oxidase subunit 3 [Sabella spallanzanii]UYP50927.1 cytochrome c oxidase subunit 3 [Sabella spallanzanii]